MIADDATTNIESDVDSNEDEVLMRKLGYKKTLHRGLAFFSSLAFGVTEVAILASVATTWNLGIEYGGPVEIFWGFLVTSIMTMIIACCMAEICSAYPSAGCVYHWTAQLVPEAQAPLASYVCGWFNFMGNMAGDASFAYSFAGLLNAGITISNGTPYDDQTTVGVAIATLFVWSVLNIFRVDMVGWMNLLAAFTHVGAVIVIIVAVLTLSPSLNTADFVFTQFFESDDTNTMINGHSYIGAVGLLFGCFCYTGYDTCGHMAEETHNSRVNAPRGIIMTIVTTSVCGIALIVALLYSSTDLSLALNGDDYHFGDTGYALVNTFVYNLPPEWAQALTWLIIINLFFAGISSVAVTGRITFALMRDRAFPFGEQISRVNSVTKSPMWCVIFAFVVDSLLLLLPLGNEGRVAFYAILGLCTLGFQVSYAIPIFLKIIYAPADFPKTPFDLGALSRPMGVIASLWLLGTSSIFFLPNVYPVTELNMNWLCVVVGGTFVLCSLNWILNSRFHFKGPKRYSDVLSKDRLTQGDLPEQHSVKILMGA